MILQHRRRIVEMRARRARRVRAKVTGTAKHPRIVVFRSLKHISAQLIDDVAGKTLVAAHDREITIHGTPIAIAEGVGKLLGEKAASKHVKQAVFDRHGYKYHGRVKALADGARKAGLTF
jgi:large subunit ribosomal protein L18